MYRSVSVGRNVNVASFFAHDNYNYLWSQILFYKTSIIREWWKINITNCSLFSIYFLSMEYWNWTRQYYVQARETDELPWEAWCMNTFWVAWTLLWEWKNILKQEEENLGQKYQNSQVREILKSKREWKELKTCNKYFRKKEGKKSIYLLRLQHGYFYSFGFLKFF